MSFIARASGVARALGVLVASLATVATASAQNYAGQWRCEMANQTVSNNAFENWMYSFSLSLYGNGSFDAQGQYYAQTNGFNMPFRAQGSWEAVQGGLLAKGQEQRQGYSGAFFLALTYYGPGNMGYRTSTASGNLAMACRQ